MHTSFFEVLIYFRDPVVVASSNSFSTSAGRCDVKVIRSLVIIAAGSPIAWALLTTFR